MTILFAATYPERVNSLVLYGAYARRQIAPDWPWGSDPLAFEVSAAALRKEWGGPVSIDLRAPSAANDPQFRQWWAKYLRMSASPGAAIHIMRLNMSIDVRAILPTIHVPALVIQRVGDHAVSVMYRRDFA